MFSPQYGKPTHSFLHISDTHLVAGGNPLYASSVNPDDVLEQLVKEFENSGMNPDAIIVTGDIADTGEAEAYDNVLSFLEPLAEKTHSQLIWLMGNHDDRALFRSKLLRQEPSSEPIDNVYNINGLRIIGLDSSVPGHHYGDVSEEQLLWLQEVLSTPAEKGTILAMHHPPLPSVLDLAATVELRNQHKLHTVLQGSDIRSIIAGHLHYSSFGMFANIPVSVATSTCYTQDLNVEVGGTRGRDGSQGFNLIHVYDETVLHSVVPIGTNPTVGQFVSAKETKTILEDFFNQQP